MPNVSVYSNNFARIKNAEYVRLLLHTDVRWLSKGNCLKGLMKLINNLSEFLDDKPYDSVTDS